MKVIFVEAPQLPGLDTFYLGKIEKSHGTRSGEQEIKEDGRELGLAAWTEDLTH